MNIYLLYGNISFLSWIILSENFALNIVNSLKRELFNLVQTFERNFVSKLYILFINIELFDDTQI